MPQCHNSHSKLLQPHQWNSRKKQSNSRSPQKILKNILTSQAQWRTLLVGAPSFPTTSLVPSPFSSPRHRRGRRCCRCCLKCYKDGNLAILITVNLTFFLPAACNVIISAVLHIIIISFAGGGCATHRESTM